MVNQMKPSNLLALVLKKFLLSAASVGLVFSIAFIGFAILTLTIEFCRRRVFKTLFGPFNVVIGHYKILFY